MESKRERETPYVDDIDCVTWLEEIDMPQYTQTFLTNFTVGGTGFLSRKRLAQVRLQDFPNMNIQNYDHQKVLMQHIRHTLKYTYQSPVRIRETQQTTYGKQRQKRIEEEQLSKKSELLADSVSGGPSVDTMQSGRRPSVSRAESKEEVKDESAESKAEKKKKKKQRRHTFDDKAWEAINKSRSAGTDNKAAAEMLRESIPAPVAEPDLISPLPVPKKKQKLRRRSTFGDSDDIAPASGTDKAAIYGNMVQEFNSWQSELYKVQEQQLNQFNSILGCSASTILFINDRTRELVAAIGGKWVSFSLDNGITAHCVNTGEVVNIPDNIEQDSRYNKQLDKLPLGVEVENMLCVPMKAMRSGAKIVGAVVMANKKNKTPFDRNDENVLTVCVERMADDIYDVFKELLNLNDTIQTMGSSFFPPAVDSSKSKTQRFLQSTANSRSGMLSSRPNSTVMTDDSIEGLRQRYLSFEIGTHSFLK